MVKKFTPPPRSTLVRSSIRLPVGMKEAMEQTMLAQAWSLKRRSNWIGAACAALLDNTDHEELIREEFYDGRTVAMPLALDSELVSRLTAVADRMTTPQRTIDRSAIIRTAITQAVLAASGRRVVTGVPLGDTAQSETT